MSDGDPELERPATSRKSPSGFIYILAATALAGVIGYVITWLVPRVIGFDKYAIYAVFWSCLFLLVSALSGIQQEITRSTGLRVPDDRSTSRRPALRFAVVASLGSAALVFATAPAWGTAVFGADGWGLVLPLAFGTASYVVFAVVSGSLYGLAKWQLLFWLICLDATLRLVAICVVLSATTDTTALAWSVSAPYSIALIVLSPRLRRALNRRARLDVDLRRLTWNVARTIVAAASLGVMVSGFPLLLGVTSGNEEKTTLGLLILVVTLTRAPLIVVAMALQSYLVVHFRRTSKSAFAAIAPIGIAVGIASVVLMLGGWAFGPWTFGVLFPGEPKPDGWLIAVLVLSSGLVGMMCVSGSALLAKSAHAPYSVGWTIAALATIGSLLVPLDLTARSALALVAGPLFGLVVHSVGIAGKQGQVGSARVSLS